MQLARLILSVYQPHENMMVPRGEKGYLYVDHIDKNKLNNNVNNLRWVTSKESAANRKLPEFILREKHNNGIFLVIYNDELLDGAEEDNVKEIKYYRHIIDVKIPSHTIFTMLQNNKYSRKHNCKFYYMEDLPDNLQKFINIDDKLW